MAQPFDLARELTPAVAGRDGAWRFIRGFADSWVSPLVAGDGYGDAELAAAEARLGVPLPAALREAYGLLGRRTDLTSAHDRLLSPDRWYLDESGEALVFRHENQGAAAWGITVGDLGLADPPVVVRADLADKDSESWEGWLERVSLAFVEIVLSESLHGPAGLCDFLGELSPDGVELIERHYTALPFPEYPACEPGSRWYAGPGVLLREDDGVMLQVRARSARELDRLREVIPGDWLDGGR